MPTRTTVPGYKTSEFWLTVLLIVAATALRLTNGIDADAWMVVCAGGGVAYNFSRGIAKK